MPFRKFGGVASSPSCNPSLTPELLQATLRQFRRLRRRPALLRSSAGLEGHFNDDRGFKNRRNLRDRAFDPAAPLTLGRSDQCHENHMEVDERGLSRRRARPRLHGFRWAGGHRASPPGRGGSRTWALALDDDGRTARTGCRPRDQRSSRGTGQGRAMSDPGVP